MPMQGWGWKKQRGPSRRPLTKVEIEDIRDKKHHETQASRLLKADRRARRAKTTTEVDALIESGIMASAPSNEDLHAEHRQRAELARRIDDLMAGDPEVSLAINQDGKGGAFVRPKKYDRAPNLIRQWVADLSALFYKPLNTNKVERVTAARPPAKK